MACQISAAGLKAPVSFGGVRGPLKLQEQAFMNRCSLGFSLTSYQLQLIRPSHIVLDIFYCWLQNVKGRFDKLSRPMLGCRFDSGLFQPIAQQAV
jgi:hypothetical protein